MTAAVLAAIAAAETEAREWLALPDDADEFRWVDRWAEDRLRLCARDRAVLEQHEIVSGEYGDFFCLRCDTYSCAEVEPVIAYWQGETP